MSSKWPNLDPLLGQRLGFTGHLNTPRKPASDVRHPYHSIYPIVAGRPYCIPTRLNVSIAIRSDLVRPLMRWRPVHSASWAIVSQQCVLDQIRCFTANEETLLDRMCRYQGLLPKSLRLCCSCVKRVVLFFLTPYTSTSLWPWKLVLTVRETHIGNYCVIYRSGCWWEGPVAHHLDCFPYL